MAKVTADTCKENYLVKIHSPSGNIVIADEPKEKGGEDKGFSPKELLASALAACTCATVRIFCNRKKWDAKNVHVEIELMEEEGKTVFNRKLLLEGNLDEAQRHTLLNVANACPVHKILTQPITVETTLA